MPHTSRLTLYVLVALLLCAVPLLFAQEESSPVPAEEEIQEQENALYEDEPTDLSAESNEPGETNPQPEEHASPGTEPKKLFTGRSFWGNVVGTDDPGSEKSDQRQTEKNLHPSEISLKAHSGPVEKIAYTKDNLNLFSCGADRQIILWDAVRGEEVRRFLGNRAPISGISVGKEGQFFASCSTLDRRTLLWNISTGTSILEYPAPPFEPSSLALGADASVLVVGQRDGNISIYRNSSESPIPQIDTFKGHLLAVNAMVLSPDEKRFLSCGNDQAVTVWDTQTRENILTFKGHRGAVLCADFAPEGNLIASAGKDRTVILTNGETGQEVKRFQGHLGDVTSVAFNADATKLISASKDRTVILWDIETGEQLKVSQKRNSPILCAALNRANSDVAVSCVNGTVEILREFLVDSGQWTVDSEQQELESSHSPLSASHSSSHSPLPTPHSSLPAIHKFINLPHGRITRRLGHTNDYSDFGSVSANGFVFASINSRRGDGMLWNIDTGKEIRILRTGQLLSAVCFHPKDSRFLFTGSRSGAIQYWNLKLEKVVSDLAGHLAPVQAIAISEDGNRLLSGATDGSLILWDLLEKKRIRTLTAGNAIHSLGFSPDAKFFAAGCEDNMIRVWDVETFTEKKLTGHSAGKISVAFMPNNRRLVSGAADGKIILWDLVGSGQWTVDSEENAKPQTIIIETQTETIQSLALAPNGRFLITGGKSEEFSLIWDLGEIVGSGQWTVDSKDQKLPTPIMLLPFQGGPVSDIVFHPKYLAVITLGGRTPTYWNIAEILER